MELSGTLKNYLHCGNIRHGAKKKNPNAKNATEMAERFLNLINMRPSGKVAAHLIKSDYERMHSPPHLPCFYSILFYSFLISVLFCFKNSSFILILFMRYISFKRVANPARGRRKN